MKLRILSVGLQLEHAQITNADFRDAPSLHDFDVVLVDPNTIIDDLFFKKTELAEVKDAVLTVKYDDVGSNKHIKRVIKQREKETRHFLSLGRLMICVLRAPFIVYLCAYAHDVPNPNKEDHWINTYDWFPLPYSSDTMLSIISKEKGNRIKLVDPKSSFAQYFNNFNKQLHYEACLGEEQKPYYFENFHTIAKTYGELPVAFSFEHQGGQVVFLPPVDNPDPKTLAGVLLDCILANRGKIEQTEPPSWLQNYKASVPGLPELEHQEETLNRDLQKLNTQLASVQQEKAETEKYLKLLYEQGKFQLEPVVRDAFSLLGFSVKEAEPSDGLLESDEGAALLEVEGKDDKPINIDKYRQLLDNVMDDEKQTQQPKKGILLGNSFRLKDPKERGEQFTQRAVDSGAGSHFCLMSTDTLFRLVCQVLEKPDDDQLKSEIRTRLLTTDGLLHLETQSNHGEE